jgi:hypothetical protein
MCPQQQSVQETFVVAFEGAWLECESVDLAIVSVLRGLDGSWDLMRGNLHNSFDISSPLDCSRINNAINDRAIRRLPTLSCLWFVGEDPGRFLPISPRARRCSAALVSIVNDNIHNTV